MHDFIEAIMRMKSWSQVAAKGEGTNVTNDRIHEYLRENTGYLSLFVCLPIILSR